MTITSWSLNLVTGKYEGWGEDEYGNRVKFEEFIQLELDLHPPLKPPIGIDFPQEDDGEVV